MGIELDAGDRTRVERVDPLVGSVLDGRFQIDFAIASGGFGSIYRGTDIESEVEIAIKVLHPYLVSDPKVVARFKREGAVMVCLRDPHTVTAYAYGEAPDGTLYIVMELLRGESLHERFRAHGPLPWKEVVAIARAVCSSLAEAHAMGVIHRDLKPANIHLEPDDTVKVLDFGIAKIVEGADLTHHGQMIGTYDYMPPEQMVGGEISGRSDIYTLGVVMYEMIAGRLPFPDATGPASLLGEILTNSPPPLSSLVIIPEALERVVARCMEREPLRRFGDVGKLAAALDALFVDREQVAVTAPMAAVMVPSEPTLLGPGTHAPRIAAGTLPVRNVPPPPPLAMPPTPFPMQVRASTVEIRPYDMASAASRDVLMRRLVWAVLLLIGSLIALFASR